MPLQSLLNASRILLRGISQVFLQGDPRLGLACLLAIAVGAPPLLAGALLGGALGPLLARLLHCADSDIEAGLYGYNAVLIGMLLAFRFAWSPGLVSLVALGCLASVALQRLFLHGLRRRRWLPPYTLGFVLNGWWLVPLGAWLGLAPATHGGCFSCAWSGTAELAALAQGIGEIIFLGEPLAGLLVWLGLLLVSRPSAAWALAGAAASLPLAWLLGYDWASALAGFYGLNAALAGQALALRYRSVWPPLLGMVLAVALQPLFGLLGLPALTAPFILACLLCIGGERLYLRLAGSLGARLGRRRS
ncbi:urea transporter [Pseudomonas aeruginosa]|uniref:urea transporter n=1 Tax=Pseudomonas aeruginosa TaxID=287 RepID=UPI0040541E1C